MWSPLANPAGSSASATASLCRVALQAGIVGTWHKVSANYLPTYPDEMVFRFNNRKNQFFRDTLIKLTLSANLEYKHLTARAENAA
jgi:hypothetical protein